jgi:hypothetical protein
MRRFFEPTTLFGVGATGATGMRGLTGATGTGATGATGVTGATGSGAIVYASLTALRAATPPSNGTLVSVPAPVGQLVYSTSSGANAVDDGGCSNVKPNAIATNTNGRYYPTNPASATYPTMAVLRAALPYIPVGARVHLLCHTTPGYGGGIFDVAAHGSETDSDVTIVVGALCATKRLICGFPLPEDCGAYPGATGAANSTATQVCIDLQGSNVSLVFGPGEYALASPLIVRAGTAHFSLRGAPTDSVGFTTSMLKTTLKCSAITGPLINRAATYAADLVAVSMSDIDAHGYAANKPSLTWTGLWDTVPTGYASVGNAVRRCSFSGLVNVGGVPVIDMTCTSSSVVEQIFIADVCEGRGLRLAQAITTPTTNTISKIYFSYVQEPLFVGANVLSTSFHGLIFDGCPVAQVSFLSNAEYTDCHYEGIGLATHTYVIGETTYGGKTVGISLQGLGIGGSSSPVDTAINMRHGHHVWRNCHFGYFTGSCVAWARGVGVASSYGEGGEARFEHCENTDVDSHNMFAQSDAYRGTFRYTVDDSTLVFLDAANVDPTYRRTWSAVRDGPNDVRSVTSGRVRVRFGDHDLRIADVCNSKLIHGVDGTAYTTGLDLAPTGAGVQVGDEIVLATPNAAGASRLVCVDAAGTGTWVDVVRGASTAWITERIKAICGAKLTTLTIVEDTPTDAAGKYPTQLISRVGAPLLYYTHDAPDKPHTRSFIYDKPTIRYEGTTTDETLYYQTVNFKAVIVVTTIPALPFTGDEMLVYAGTPTELKLMGNNGLSTLYAQSGQTRYVDGTATDDVSGKTGLVVLESTGATTYTACWFFQSLTSYRTWGGYSQLTIILNDELTSGERAALVPALRAYRAR